jgi:hypothetical protein
MIGAYLWLNAALYALFALWCTVQAGSTSQALGYAQLTNSGRSEYLVIYGGLQLGLGVFFAVCASRPSWHSVGLVLALLVYAPVVAFRWWTVEHRPVAGMTIGVGVLETALLAAAVALWLSASLQGVARTPSA